MFHSVSNATVETLITYHRQYDTNNIPITTSMKLITFLARSDESGQARVPCLARQGPVAPMTGNIGSVGTSSSQSSGGALWA